MRPIRVLVIDDSTVIRKVLCEALASDPEIEVVATAPNGRIGLAKIEQLNPDLVTLDVEMPIVSGLEALAQIRKRYAKLPVIMFSTLTERGAATTLDALALGATDYVTKPGQTGSLDATLERIREELVPKVKTLCSTVLRKNKIVVRADGPKVAATRPKTNGPQRVEILAIGTSTGGPLALSELLPAIPRDFPVPIVVVQHMPPLFTKLLAERLDKLCAIRVREGKEGGELKPGEAWIAPGNFHMEVERNGLSARLRLHQEPPENSCRPAVDVLFRSVAKAFGPGALAVVLTGMGADGVRGAQVVREYQGDVLVQDEESSVVWGMPGQVATAGYANGIFSLKAMAQEIEQRVRAKQNEAAQGKAGFWREAENLERRTSAMRNQPESTKTQS